MTGIAKITKENPDGTVEIKELSAPELLKELIQEKEVNDRNAQIAADSIYELSQEKEHLLAELAELRKKAEALEWLIHRFPITFIGVDMIDDCPEIFKQMIEQKERTNG